MSRRALRFPGNWWSALRRRGVLATGRAALARFVYHSRQYIITYDLCAGPAVPDHVGDVVFRLATPADFDRLAELEPYGRGASTHRPYVERDHDWLFVACDGERVVATRRASRLIRDSVISRVITLEAGQVWAADVFCLPEYRNRHIGRHLQVFGDRYLATLGYTERFGAMLATNVPSLRSAFSGGRKPLYFVSHVRILFWERLRVSKNIPRAIRDLLPGSPDYFGAPSTNRLGTSRDTPRRS